MAKGKETLTWKGLKLLQKHLNILYTFSLPRLLASIYLEKKDY